MKQIAARLIALISALAVFMVDSTGSARPSTTTLEEPPSDVLHPSALAGGTVSNVSVRIGPFDGTTSARNTPPYALISDSRERLSAEEVASWTSRLHVVGWPTERTIPGEWVYRAPDTGRGDHVHRFDFISDIALGSGWHAVELSAPPDELPPPGVCARQDGVWLARFRTDSHPTLEQVEVVGGAESRVIRLRFSERVFLSSESVSVRVEGRSSRCLVEDDGDPFGSASLLLSCGPLDGTVEIQLGNDVTTIDGNPVTTPRDRGPVAVDLLASASVDAPSRDLVSEWDCDVLQ